MSRSWSLAVAAAGVLLSAAWAARAEVAVPTPTGRVTDQTGTLSGETVNHLETELADLETRKGSQIAVLIVPTTQPEEIEQFGIRVADQWKLGRKGIDDGLILLVAKNDRRVRIEVGRGLEGAVPDAIASRIIAETITPHFKLGDYDGGVEAGVTQLVSVVNGESLPEPDRQWERPQGVHNLLPLLLVGVFVASGILRSVLGRLLGSLATGGLAGVIAWLISHLLTIGVGAGVVGFVFALLLGSSRAWTAGGGGWGGGFGGGFGAGGGFGGRGGGGGRVWRWWRWLQRRRRLGELVMQLSRLLRHAAVPHWRTRLLFPRSTLDAIEAAIGRAERTHGGEIRFVIETALAPLAVLNDVDARARAVQVFARLGVWDTEHNNGVLIYVQVADRRVEIVADRGLRGIVSPTEWEAVCRLMEAHFGGGRFQAGAIAGVDAVGTLLARHFPPAAGRAESLQNQLPDRPTLL